MLSRIVNLVSRFFLRIGDWGRWRLAEGIDAVLWSLTKLVYGPLAMCGISEKKMWYGSYFLDFLFNERINNRMDRLQMYHDFLTSEIIEYYSRAQLEEWVKEAGYKRAEYFFYRKQSWSVAASFNLREDFSGR